MQRRYSLWSAVLVVVLQSAIFNLPSAEAQVPGILNYQGRVAVNGTNFDGTGQFKFALVDAGSNLSRQATALSYIVAGFIVSNAVTDGGAGYVTPPAISYTGGGGSGASAYALIGGGAVTAIVINPGGNGSGYSTPPTVVIDPPPVNMLYQTYWSNGASSVSVPVTKGLYSVLLGDTNIANMGTAVPAVAFTNSDVRLRVWFNGQQLSPDQRIAAVGYALMAATVPASGISGKLSDGQLSANVALLTGSPSFTGTVSAAGFTGSGAGLTNVTALGAGAVSNTNLSAQTLSNTFWRLAGNAGTTPGTHFIGTTDNQPVEVKVNGTRALRIEPNSSAGAPNLIGGAAVNAVGGGIVGATIGGGGATNYSGFPYTNRVDADFGTIGGGRGNNIQGGASDSTIGGGFLNIIQNNAYRSMIGGGWRNTIQSDAILSTIGGGEQNSIQTYADYATIGGGYQNSIKTSADYATIGGGVQNSIQTNATTATIGGGSGNSIQTNANDSVIGGGYQNSIQSNAPYATIGGGIQNSIQPNAYRSTIGGGSGNNIQTNAIYATIGGGIQNSIQVDAGQSTIGGGQQNIIQNNAQYATIGGGQGNSIQTNARHATISGGERNSIQLSAIYSTIGGGILNSIKNTAYYSMIGGGNQNSIGYDADRAMIGGGYQNTIQDYADDSTIGGGQQNRIQTNAYYSTIGGGGQNSIQPNTFYAIIGGGYQNSIQSYADYAAIGGGQQNTAGGQYSTVPGGLYNSANGTYSFAAGRRAKALHDGAFVWGDSSDEDISSTANNQFIIRASGGVGIGKAPGDAMLDVKGNIRLNDYNLFLRANGVDRSHGLGWYNSGEKPFGTSGFGDGPVLYGNSGGALGTTGPTNIALQWDNSKNVGINGGLNVSGGLNAFGAINLYGSQWMNDTDLYFRGDRHHGMGWYGGGKLFAGANVDGPALYGYSGGVLGATPDSGTNIALLWDNSRNVTVNNNLTVYGNAYKPGGGTWSSTSDERLKKNIQPLTGVLDKVLALRGVSFEYIDPAKVHELPGERIGMIAQEIEKVFPDWVSTGTDGYKRVTYRGFEALTVEALRELRAENERQMKEKDAAITQLQRQNAELERRLKAVEEKIPPQGRVGPP